MRALPDVVVLLVSFKAGWDRQAFPQVRICTLITPRKHSPIRWAEPPAKSRAVQGAEWMPMAGRVCLICGK